MNGSSFWSGSGNTTATNTDDNDPWIFTGRLKRPRHNGPAHHSPISTLVTTQHARLINASCKAFFVKRGLDPDTDTAYSGNEK